MHFTINIFCVVNLLFATGCAYEGTVVRKEFHPLPFSDSLGIAGFYYFDLRDRDGILHHQMVTPEVFAQYRVGGYFNDLAQPSFASPVSPEPTLLSPPRRLEEFQTHYRTGTPPDDPPRSR